MKLNYSLNSDLLRFAEDHHDEGLDQQWMEKDSQPYLDKDRTIVPSTWNRETNVKHKDYEGVAWYFRMFKIPDTFKDREYNLVFKSISHHITIFIDGVKVGEPFHGSYVPVKYDTTNITAGENHFLAVRIDGRKETFRYKEIKDTKLHSGIIGDVYIETKEYLVLHDFNISYELKDDPAEPGKIKYTELAFYFYLNNNSEKEFNGEVNIQLTRDYVDVASITREINVQKQNSRLAKIPLNVDMTNAELWSPENPALYNFSITIGNADGNLIEISEILGLRKIEFKDDFIYINRQKLIPKACEFQIENSDFGFDTPAMILQKQFTELKKEGYNVLRPNQPLISPAFFEYASRYGFIVINDLPLTKMTLKEKQNFFKAYIHSITYHASLALYSINPDHKDIKLSGSDPEFNQLLFDWEEILKDFDPTRLFVPVSDFSIENWAKKP